MRTTSDVTPVSLSTVRAPWRGEDGQWEDLVAFNEEWEWANG
jgi:hypothetical protein